MILTDGWKRCSTTNVSTGQRCVKAKIHALPLRHIIASDQTQPGARLVCAGAKERNAETVRRVGEPTATELYTRVKSILDSKSKIPLVHSCANPCVLNTASASGEEREW